MKNCCKLLPVLICLLLLLSPAVRAVTTAHDFTLYRVTGRDVNGATPGDLRRWLQESRYELAATLTQDSAGLDEKVLPGDVVLIGEAHSGIVGGVRGIEHFLTDGGQSVAPRQVFLLPAFRSGWALAQVLAYRAPDGAMPFRELSAQLWRVKSKAVLTTVAQPLNDWVLYATGPGWLRCAPRSVFAAPQRTSEEIWGGNSNLPLDKRLLKDGFATREIALKYLTERLSRVRLEYGPLATPREWISAVFEGVGYNLRLTFGNDPESVLHRGQEYELESERRLLAEHGLTPRADLGRLQWLVHATGHGTTQGPVRDDRWMMIPSAPRPDPKNPAQSLFVIADGFGGTFTYSCDRFEGPYRDNFGLAKAMFRLRVPEVEVWPPGQNYVRKVVAEQVPSRPTDFGALAPALQPMVDPEELRDWVIYVTNKQWLHIGTRTEFATAVQAGATIWAGTGTSVVPKTEIAVTRKFRAYEDALRFVCRNLADVRIAFHPLAQPRETVTGFFSGKEYHLQVAHDPDQIVAGYGSYNLAAEIENLRGQGVTAVRRFGRQWLVHATGHGTFNGPVKDDLWMMVGTEPRGGGVTIPDGIGGTFGYSVDQVVGPFEDSNTLAGALRARGVKSVRLVAEDRFVASDDFLATDRPETPPPPRVLRVTPDSAEPGRTFYVTANVSGMKRWFRLSFGPRVTVSNETYLGRDPDGNGDRWLATVSVDPNSFLGEGNLQGAEQPAFLVEEKQPVSPPGAGIKVQTVPITATKEWKDFVGFNDLPVAGNWEERIDDYCAAFVDRVDKFPGATNVAKIRGERGFGQHSPSLLNAPPSDLFVLLGLDDPPASLATSSNVYARVTPPYEAQLRERILASKGNLMPADVIGMALEITEGSYPLAVLTAHNLLKNVTKIGRDAVERGGDQVQWNRKHDQILGQLRRESEVAGKLVSLRANPRKSSEKMGPWYHIFAILSCGGLVDALHAEAITVAEHAAKWVKGFANEGGFNAEKASIDIRFQGVARDRAIRRNSRFMGLEW